jgi:tRNA A-37 threonylcarbamoyl transferase component Bud32
MAFAQINPAYRDSLQGLGLAAPEDFFHLPAIIVGGHPDRHVGRVFLGNGPDKVACYLKREHRIRRRDRLAGALAGFGFCSKSVRELQTLDALGQAGAPCPEWIAGGETERGQGFLLVRELPEAIDLRVFLHELGSAPARRRERFVRKLGMTLAQVHGAGFDHPDLYAKHVVVQAATGQVSILDWQRSGRRGPVSWPRRCRDLAALNATLATGLLSVSERILCLRAYLRACRRRGDGDGGGLLPVAFRVFRRSERLLQRRRIREMHQLPTVKQQVVWLDGEALCVTPEFLAVLDGKIPYWLRLSGFPSRPRQFLERRQVRLAGQDRLLLVRRRVIRPWAGLWTWLRGRRLTSPELGRAREIFRLQRAGVVTDTLLAFGQRCPAPWRIESLLLTQPHKTRDSQEPVVSNEAGLPAAGPVQERVR